MARKYSESELLQFILLYLDGNSHQTLVNNYNLKLSEKPFRGYVKKFELHGMEGLKYRRSNRRYTKEFKEKVVSEHFENGYGMHYLANKYNIPSHSTVKDWINRYTGGKENKTYSPKSEVYNIMGAKKLYKTDYFI